MDRQTASATFPSAAAAVADARRFVRKVLADWGMEDAADDAVLATSELATNAVAYAGTSFEVTCRVEDGDIRVEVRDRDGAPDRAGRPAGRRRLQHARGAGPRRRLQ
ncbi:ATP-binding protein, partial [Actinomadura roseirufa]|uniref:ATP-binding protein n=1 Tax=Actinomadura roseirufa TaxID=2094049 RepID=UPI0013F15B25